MSTEYRAKVFKSGNSLALRLPKALGLKEGTEMIVREDQARYSFEPVEPPRATLDISRIWGKAPDLTVPPRDDFEQRPSTIARRQAQDEEAE